MQPHHKQSNSSCYGGCEPLICTTVVFSPAYKIHKEPLLLQQVIKSQWDKRTKWTHLLTKWLLLLPIKSLFCAERAAEKHLRSRGRIWDRLNRHLLDVSVVPTVIPSPLTSPVLMTYAVTSPERRKQKGNAVVIWSSPNNGHPTQFNMYVEFIFRWNGNSYIPVLSAPLWYSEAPLLAARFPLCLSLNETFIVV